MEIKDCRSKYCPNQEYQCYEDDNEHIHIFKELNSDNKFHVIITKSMFNKLFEII